MVLLSVLSLQKKTKKMFLLVHVFLEQSTLQSSPVPLKKVLPSLWGKREGKMSASALAVAPAATAAAMRFVSYRLYIRG